MLTKSPLFNPYVYIDNALSMGGGGEGEGGVVVWYMADICSQESCRKIDIWAALVVGCNFEPM